MNFGDSSALAIPGADGRRGECSVTETVAEQIVGAVIPVRRKPRKTEENVRALPLAEQVLSRDGSMHYRIASVDHRGRMAESSLMRVLGWLPADRVDVATTSGVVVFRRNRYGAFHLTRRGHVQLPLSVRRWCGVRPGDRVLLAAAPELGALIVHTMAVLDGMVLAYHDQA